MQGNLSEIPLPELLGVLSSKNGILHLDALPLIGRMDLHVFKGNLCACVVAEQIIRREEGVLEKLIAVTIMSKGHFEFEQSPSERLQYRCKLPAQGLALEVVSRSDEILSRIESFPDAAQVFRSTGNPRMAEYPDPLLNFFVEESAEMFRYGSSAEKLAEYLQISVEQVRHHIASLLEAGAIAPLSRDALWSRLDKALDAKSITAIRVRKADGTIGKPSPQPTDEPPRKPGTQLIGSSEQKIIPKLTRQPVNKPFPETKSPVGP